MAVSAQIGCGWCLDFAYFQAFNEHLDMDKAREVLGARNRIRGVCAVV
jgi:hypothetical protein